MMEAHCHCNSSKQTELGIFFNGIEKFWIGISYKKIKSTNGIDKFDVEMGGLDQSRRNAWHQLPTALSG